MAYVCKVCGYVYGEGRGVAAQAESGGRRGLRQDRAGRHHFGQQRRDDRQAERRGNGQGEHHTAQDLQRFFVRQK